MMMRRVLRGAIRSVHARRLLEGLDFTSVPSPLPGQVIGRPVPSRWDDRCIPVFWQVNDTQDPVPNPPGAPLVTVAEATATLQRALDAWNEIPTSYIDMRLVGTVSNPGFAGFDLVNEVTFQSAGGFAFTRLTRLVEDSVLEDGDDLNGDGVPDVSAAIPTCQDVSGRTRFPAGFYKAGTILDADVVLDPADVPVTVRDEDVGFPAFDLQHVATHELGHALGLGHSCAIGFWGGRRPSLAGYVTLMGPRGPPREGRAPPDVVHVAYPLS